jgi:protein-disulfide isomerase
MMEFNLTELHMSFPLRRLRFGVAAIALAVAAAASQASLAQTADKLDKDFEAAIGAIITDHLAKHPDEVERIVKDYLVKHPEVMRAAILGMLKRPASAAVPEPPKDKSALIASNAPALFGSTHQVTLGDRQGDVTLVEFFDYNCGFCKRALADTLSLLKTQPHLKIVLKEFPVLGPGSLEAARVAIAARMQDAEGAKYLEFHQRLLGGQGPASKARALEIAGAVGFDVGKIEQDMMSDEVNATLAENARLARELGINGTPSYVISNRVIVGAVGIATLNESVKAARN